MAQPCQVCQAAKTAVWWSKGHLTAVCWSCFGLLAWIDRHGLPMRGTAPPGYMTVSQVANALHYGRGNVYTLPLIKCKIYGRTFWPVAEVHRWKSRQSVL